MLNKSFFQKTLIFLAIIAIFIAAFIIYKPTQSPVSQEAKNIESGIWNLENQKPKPNITYTTLFFAGDIMLSRNVHDKMNKANDFTLPFKNTTNEISSADIAVANLESPFNNNGAHFIEGSLVFNADPKSIEGLKFTGFDILSLANNHSLDQGLAGLDFTLEHLINNGIIPTGVTNSKKETIDPVIEKNKLVFGFLSYSYTGLNDGGKTASPYVNDFNDIDKMKSDIIRMKGHTADIVIVSMHAGVEYTRTPNEKQIKFAHAAIDAGADFVIGHHPHWIQTIEHYTPSPLTPLPGGEGQDEKKHEGWIFYSLGNFVFDQMWSTDTREGLTVFLTYGTADNHPALDAGSNQEQIPAFAGMEIKKIELKPVIIDNFCCPRWANENETKGILKKINLTSPVVLDKN
jgi:poly-gamma-glutamate synthesis protein (capsule biosynthesis protein)